MDTTMISYLDINGKLSSNFKGEISDDLIVHGYKVMVITRLVDERMITLQRQGAISFALSSKGEEACSVASAAALKIEDWLYPQYRENGTIFFRGFTIQQYVDQMFGNKNDKAFGRQMPNHFGERELNVVTVSSPIGTKIPHAAGAAYAMKLQKEKSVAVCYFGEGATSSVDFHAGLNFAAVKKAPAIFFCRNNGYAISTPAYEQFASFGIAPKGAGYGMPAYVVDGNDFFAVYDVVSKARSYCLEGKGPVLIEAITYRLGAHSTSDDPSVYRKDSEVQEWEKKCPILRLRLYLESKNLWNENLDRELKSQIDDEISKAIEKAKMTATPDLKMLFEHVYFEMPAHLKKEWDDLKCQS